jgi:diguanylate cyclase (GGDEF)-like protein
MSRPGVAGRRPTRRWRRTNAGRCAWAVHDAGDFVLSAVARAITTYIRPSDIACRYGGEELLVVLPEVNLECARERAEQLRLAIRDTNLTHLGQTLPAPTASFGVAVYPANGTTPADLLKAADQALFRAKPEGRDRVCAATEAVPAGSSPTGGARPEHGR